MRNISFILAGTILLMHSVLPHHHHGDLNENQNVNAHETASSLLDFVKLAFHVDLGQDHLESYNVAQYEQVSFDILSVAINDFLFEASITEISFPKRFPFQENLHARFLSHHLSVRGPPQLS
ncbi:MAG: hypothetical protein ACI8QD_000453 [Cyclobacteriaceae bacterium]|jgi:hypothetical protein